MARSRHVYLVMQNVIPVAAFTVKHELVAWLGRSEQRDRLNRFTVFRLPDGGYGSEPVQLSKDDLLASDG